MLFVGLVFAAFLSTSLGLSVPRPTNSWFSFGDSYTATSFNVQGIQPSIGNPLGNPPYPDPKALLGTNWVDVDTVKYNHSLVLTYNLAVGGATINSSLVFSNNPLTDQVNVFLNNYAAQPRVWRSERTLFSIWIGINDLQNSYSRSGDRNSFSDVLLNALFSQVQKLYDAGARNFLFINVPPIHQSPVMLTSPYATQMLEKSVILDYNSKLLSRVKSFKLSHYWVQTFFWDSYAGFETILGNLSSYGFNADPTAYGNPGDFWANSFHPSSAAHEIFGRDISTVLERTVW